MLSWAQREATEAISQWHAGNKQGAQEILGNARNRVANAAEQTAGIIGRARDKAPQQPGFWSDVGGFLESAWHGAEDIGAGAVNGLASFGNAMVNHPGDVGTMLGGALLMGVGAVGDAGGAVLDATGVGAVVGVPANVVSTAAVATGATLMAASGGDLASHAAGDDSEDPVQASKGSGGNPASTEGNGTYTGGSPLSTEQLDEAYNSASTE